MNLIRKGSRGQTVKSIQYFLNGAGFTDEVADGVFGPKTLLAVKKYQETKGLIPDGIIGNQSLARMLQDGLKLMEEPTDYPEKPDFLPLVSNSERDKIFGKFKYVPASTPSNPEGIDILGDWVLQNIVRVDIPQLAKATKGEFTRMSFHKLAADQLKGLWEDWEKNGLLDLVLSYEGSFYPRYVRGSRRTLSNHSWGTAFDINYWWNQLGRVPAAKGAKGSVRELVPLAHKWGFYWGGHFSRSDGMHFEVAKLV